MSKIDGSHAGSPAVKMVMVVTLRSGAQIRLGVDSFEAKANALTGELTSLNWITDNDPAGSSMAWVSLTEVVAVHAERVTA